MAIDPGNEYSAFVVIESETVRPLRFGKFPNAEMLGILRNGCTDVSVFVIEKVASYGMPVGREVFDTCEMIGRFTEIIVSICGTYPHFVFRIDEKEAICHDSRASDANIRRALIDRFAKHDLKNGKGTMKNPDWFYGFANDVWAAYAVGFTWLEERRRQKAQITSTTA